MSFPLIMRKMVGGTIVVSLVLGAYCFFRYQQEQRWLARQAREIVARAGAGTRGEQVVALRNYVRRYVRYEGAPHDERPFLRATAMETLQTGQGYCGEATRAFVNLAGQLEIPARRVNLYGRRINHVIAEVEIRPGADILVDPQDNPDLRGYFDRRDLTVDDVVGRPGAVFDDSSNLHLKRVPLIALFVPRIRLKPGWLTWTLENPWLIDCHLFVILAATLSLYFVIPRIPRRARAFRFGAPGIPGEVTPVAPHRA